MLLETKLGESRFGINPYDVAWSLAFEYRENNSDKPFDNMGVAVALEFENGGLT